MSTDSKQYAFDLLEQSVKSIFSWIVLMPISIIISGKLLAKSIKFTVTSKQIFRIRLIILDIQATDGEVILGFTGFIISLLLIGIFSGKAAYELVKINFGIDPGQFNAICMLTSFITVAWSFVIFFLYKLMSGKRSPSFLINQSQYDRLIQRLSSEHEDTK